MICTHIGNRIGVTAADILTLDSDWKTRLPQQQFHEKTIFLIENARDVVHAGYTTVQEVFRVLGPQV
jgi:hypothetical protein